MDVIKETTECAFNLTKSKGDICSPPEVIDKLCDLAKTYNKNTNTNNHTECINVIKEKLKCDVESCIYKHQDVIKIFGHEEVQKLINIIFKPYGPWNSNSWFSNVHIDSVLAQIQKKFKKKYFLHIPFQMIDFKKTNSELGRLDIVSEYNNGTKFIGSVINTDSSGKSGQHWFAIFIDMAKEPISIEYYNSAGGSINEIDVFANDLKHTISKNLNKESEYHRVVDTRIQNDNHSCGSYSLFYIISRLSGKSFKELENLVNDDLMHEVRKHLFRKNE